MTVEELIDKLQGIPEEFQVIMSRDEEGNGFSPLYNIDFGKYEPDTAWSGEFMDVENADDMNAICLWPVS